jgi:SulP family sulfate permease
MEDVPLIDATGAIILKKFFRAVRAKQTRVILSGVQPGPVQVLKAMQVDILQAGTLAASLELARTLIA